ncbi:peroxide stress protein YaaA [Empedobacter sedimenti]|uniref:peroxide stress protein YaaA n=1 Tax=Empedobacter sedimenti TaxID=3042610 RepID=UPI0024A6586A|nr:peroxide stress protein YaaA [Empedobacter sedimenti]
MKILLSPAKMMNLETDVKWKATTPQFLEQSEEIMNVMKEMNATDLEKLMKISKDIADMNVERNQVWNIKPTAKKAIPAALAFKGEVYRGLDASTLNDEAINYLNKNAFLLSGLYGILRPSDKVMLYRLEMGSKLDVNGSKNLYGFWKETLTPFVNSKLKKGEFILNLASNEYAKVLDRKSLKVQVYDVEFQDYKNGELKKIMMYFKHARGAMARYCAENNVTTLDEVKAYNVDGYRFDENLSSNETLIFTR